MMSRGMTLKKQYQAAQDLLARGEPIAATYDPDMALFEDFNPFDEEETTPPPVFPVACLPDELREYALAVAESIQVPVDMPAVIGLAIVALCVQGKCRIQPRPDDPGWTEPLNLYAAVIAPPSERKSPALAAMSEVVRKFEEQTNIQSAPEISRWQNEKEILEGQLQELKRKVIKNKASMDEVHAMQQELDELEANAVKPLQLLCDDSTPEALASLLAENHERMAVVSSEGGIFDTIAGRYTGSMNLDLFLKAFTCEPYRVDRKGRPPEYLRKPTLTLLLTLQPIVMRALLTEKGFTGRGFTQRFLFSMPQSAIGGRFYRHEAIPAKIKQDYDVLMEELLQLNPAETITLQVSEDADRLACAFFDELEPKLRTDYANLEGWAGKIHGTTMRIAGILHCAKCGKEAGSAIISANTMQSAIQIGRYFITHAVCAFSEFSRDKAQSPAELDAKYILERFKQTGSASINKGELQRLCNRFARAKDMKKGLDVLIERGYLRLDTIKTGEKGRPAQVLILNPLAR